VAGRSNRGRGERGASAVELSFIAPGLLALIFLSIQAALYFYGQNVALQAAREGTSKLRLASDRATYDAFKGDVEELTKSFASTVGRSALIDPRFESAYDEAAGRVRVRVSGEVITLIPGLDLTVSQVAEGPVERFEGPRGPGATP
jgi:TadE-like protein